MDRSLKRCFLVSLLSFVIAWSSGCGHGDQGPLDPGQALDRDATPIVFAHGALEVGDAFANQSMRFAANGYPLDRIYAYDWNTLGNFDESLAGLTAFVDRVLDETGADRIDLIGHSMGTALSAAYLEEPAHADKVAHYANIAGFSGDAPPGGVPTLTISSGGDRVVGISSITGARNEVVPDQDHLQVATSPETFAHLYRFFKDGESPRTVEMEPTGEMVLSGRMVTFAENQPAPGLELRVFPVDPATGERLTLAPVATFVSDSEGNWGPFDAVPGGHYEYEILDDSPFLRPLHYYREPLPRSCRLVYFRVFPPLLSPAGLALALLPYDDDTALFATLNMNRATIAGRDTLFVDGIEISTPEITPAEKSALAIFFFDANSNGESEGEAGGGILGSIVFFQIVDLIVETDRPRAVPMRFNGRTLAVRNWKSDSEGVTIAVFE